MCHEIQIIQTNYCLKKGSLNNYNPDHEIIEYFYNK